MIEQMANPISRRGARNLQRELIQPQVNEFWKWRFAVTIHHLRASAVWAARSLFQRPERLATVHVETSDEVRSSNLPT